MFNFVMRLLAAVGVCSALTQCGSYSLGPPNMGGPTAEARAAKIAGEASGDFYYGRRYFVEKTRFWGYLRKPRQPWSSAKLVIFKEHKKASPDRLPEDGPEGQRYAFDNNCEYRLRGYFTGKEGYEPNSNQFLPEFMLTGYEMVESDPGWLFQPDDHYERLRITLYPH
ncbi:MAG: hypothetical protein WCP35_15655 [Verrucomicrobiota bacterium]